MWANEPCEGLPYKHSSRGQEVGEARRSANQGETRELFGEGLLQRRRAEVCQIIVFPVSPIRSKYSYMREMEGKEKV